VLTRNDLFTFFYERTIARENAVVLLDFNLSGLETAVTPKKTGYALTTLFTRAGACIPIYIFDSTYI